MFKNFMPIVLVLPFILGGCATTLSSSEYDVAQVGEATHTYQGTIVQKRIVKVEGNSTSQVVGAITGGLLGGLFGNQFGGGTGKVVTTIAGGALGGVAGNEVGKKLSSQEAYEYTVKLKDNSMRTVVQGADVDIPVGQHVLLQVSSGGRSRIMMDTSAQ